MFWIVSAITVLLDFASKYLVDTYMNLQTTVALIPGIFDLTYIRNNGMAWSLFAGKKYFLIVVTSVLLLAVLGYVIIAAKKVPLSERFALGLIFGGGLANLLSRILTGYVIDFLNIYIIPIFNVADIAITCGCILLALSVLIIEPARQKKQNNEQR